MTGADYSYLTTSLPVLRVPALLPGSPVGWGGSFELTSSTELEMLQESAFFKLDL